MCPAFRPSAFRPSVLPPFVLPPWSGEWNGCKTPKLDEFLEDRVLYQFIEETFRVPAEDSKRFLFSLYIWCRSPAKSPWREYGDAVHDERFR